MPLAEFSVPALLCGEPGHPKAAADALALLRRMDGHATAPMLAVRDGHTALALELLALGASATQRCAGNGAQPLHFAAMAGDVAVGRALLMAGADVDAPKLDPDGHHTGTTALMWAANRRHPAFVEFLIDAGAAVDLRAAEPQAGRRPTVPNAAPRSAQSAVAPAASITGSASTRRA